MMHRLVQIFAECMSQGNFSHIFSYEECATLNLNSSVFKCKVQRNLFTKGWYKESAG